MESGRFVLAIVLMIAVIVVTNLLFPPEPPRPAAVEAPADTTAPMAPAAADTSRAVTPAERMARAAPAPPVGPADTIVVASPLYRYALSTRGAAVVGAELLEFPSFSQPGPVQLVPPDVAALVGYQLRIGDRVVELGNLPFRAEPDGPVAVEPGGGARTVQLIHEDPQGAFSIRLRYTFVPDHYLIDVEGDVTVPGAEPPVLGIELGPTLAVHEAEPRQDYRALAFVVNGTREGIRSVSLDDVEAQRIEEGPLTWVALKNKYFLAAAMTADEEAAFGGLIASPTPREHAADLVATLPVGRDGTFAYRLYLGPQEPERLAALGNGLEDVNPIGWAIFRPIIRPLAHVITWAIVALHRILGLGYGWVLILFGVLIRGILWPLNAKAMRSQMKNMALQPRIQEIQKKYKDNPERLQKEMIRLYREEGFNPLGGCLPMLIPYPVLITLYFVFLNTIEFRGVGFLWLPDLSRPDPLYILPLLLGASMFLMQRISARVTPPNPQTKMFMYFMPAVMVVIFLNFASGLNLYYVAQNVASIPQQIQLAKERQRQQRR
ncbi:MAG TPA: membrane protein insertase YidC [Longimicrobiales bacterium]